MPYIRHGYNSGFAMPIHSNQKHNKDSALVHETMLETVAGGRVILQVTVAID